MRNGNTIVRGGTSVRGRRVLIPAAPLKILGVIELLETQ